ncbi:FAD-dependent thymidylate synthase, partial [Finegoldia magna]
MKVNLIRYTPDAQKLVASSAKLCYSDSSVMEIEEGLTDENVENFIDKLMDLGHMSPVEHISFTFAIEGVSRTLTHQLVRHRLASYSQKSQRYVRA